MKRLEALREAYYGDQEAFEGLSPADQKAVLEKRGKVYYAGRNKEIRDAIRVEEQRLGD